MRLAVVATIGGSALLTGLLAMAARRVALRTALVAVPREQRFGQVVTPLGGGVAILLGIVLPSLGALAAARVWAATGLPAWLPEMARVHLPGLAARAEMGLALLGGAVAISLLGLYDDRRPLGAWSKLAGQLVVVLAVLIAVPSLRVLTLAGAPVSFLLSALWMLVIINALNFLDNMDGLAAGVALVCACCLLATAAAMGQLFVVGWLCLLIGALLGFLWLNFPPARLYMGDAGSLLLGYLLAVLTMLTTYYPQGSPGARPYTMLVPVVLLAIPLYDFLSVLTIRLREKRSPLVGDTRHFSHRLIGRGMSVRAVLLTVCLATAVTGIAAILLPGVSDFGALLLGAQTLGVVTIIALLEWAGERR